MQAIYAIETSLGTFHAMEEDGVVTNLLLPNQKAPAPQGQPRTNLAAELSEYLAGKRKVFTVTMQPLGPTFHRAVWEALMAVPYGETLTYAELAANAGKPGAARAAGQAVAKNPLPVLIPCHRVVYAHGKKQNYQGGAGMKEFLLKLEKDNK